MPRLNDLPSRHPTLRTALAVLLTLSVAVSSSACGLAAEENSGGDAYRNEAAELKLDEWAVDDIAYAEGDRTDWKFIMLSQPTAFVVELSADDEDATIKLGVYDRYGMRLGLTERNEHNKVATIKIKPTARGGKHFVMIQAASGDATSYQVRVKVGESGGGGGGDLPDF